MGLYLLYRIAPLLSLVRSLQTTALWLGAGGATIAALAALMQEDLRATLVYLGAVQGGLVLFAAGSGVKAAIWLSVLVLTPLRLLFFLGAAMIPSLDSPPRRKLATAFLGMGALTLIAFNLLTIWWARKANASLDALFVVEAAVALMSIRAVRTVWQLARHPSSVEQKRGVGWIEWLTVGGLSTAMVIGGVWLRPLARHLEAISGMTLPTIPALPTLLHYSATTPAMLAVMVLLFGIWQLQRRSKPRPPLSAEPVGQTYDLEDGLARAARALYAVIEVGILERTLLLVVRGVVEGAQLIYRIVEQEGLEGFLRRSVQAILAANRGLQRWHTGKLRYNLLWIALTLALAWCILVHTTAYCQGVEALLGLEVPPRARYLRSLLCELERIHSHLLWLGVLAENIGFTTIFMYAWRDREITLDIMEELSGGRVSHAANVIGGVRIELDDAHVRSILARLAELEQQIETFLGVIQHERTFRARTQGVGHLTAEQVRRYCVVGPMARASGVDVDVRRDAPYAAYDRLAFRVVTAQEGDVWARTWVRAQEINESLHLCRQLLKDLPEGPLTARVPRRVPPGEVVSRAEAPRGELLYYIRSDGSDRPARVKVRTPTLTGLITLEDQMRDSNIADVPAIMGGMDLCIACADR